MRCVKAVSVEYSLRQGQSLDSHSVGELNILYFDLCRSGILELRKSVAVKVKQLVKSFFESMDEMMQTFTAQANIYT